MGNGQNHKSIRFPLLFPCLGFWYSRCVTLGRGTVGSPDRVNWRKRKGNKKIKTTHKAINTSRKIGNQETKEIADFAKWRRSSSASSSRPEGGRWFTTGTSSSASPGKHGAVTSASFEPKEYQTEGVVAMATKQNWTGEDPKGRKGEKIGTGGPK